VVVQRTNVLAMLSPLLEVCGRASVILESIPVLLGSFIGISASCFGGIRILQEVHTTWVGSIAVRSGGMLIDSLLGSGIYVYNQ